MAEATHLMSIVFLLLSPVLSATCSTIGVSTGEHVANVASTENVEGHYNVIEDKHKGSYQQITKGVNFTVSINTDTVKHTVDRRFLSFGVSVKEIVHNGRDFQHSKMVIALASALSPAVFRVGGKSADEAVFVPGDGYHPSHNSISRFRMRNGNLVNRVMTGEIWKDLLNFTNVTGIDPLFNFNLLLSDGERWDPTNAKELLDFNSKLGYKVMWQLGNEPNLFPKNYGVTMSGKQVGKAFNELRRILSMEDYRANNFLVGPDITHLPINTKAFTSDWDLGNNTAFLEKFLLEAGTDVNATTIHFYNVRRENTTSVEEFIDPDTLDKMANELDLFERTMGKFMPPQGSRTRWLGETSTCTGGGIEASGTFVAGFILMSNLGVAASKGISVFTYWSFMGSSNYALISYRPQRPKPMYWVAYLHKRFVGRHVLSVLPLVALHPDSSTWSKRGNDVNASRYVRVFAHCTTESSSYPVGAVTIMAINMLNASYASLNLTGRLAGKAIDEYQLSPHGGNIQAREIKLNGEKLQMIHNDTFPPIVPRHLSAGSNISLPPMTYGFFVIPLAHAPACQAASRPDGSRREAGWIPV